MLIVLFIIVGLLFIISAGEDLELLACILGCGLIAIIIAGICMMNNVQEGKVINKKITLYEKENKELEEKIEVAVKNYMDFEKETYKELKVDSYMNLVNLYPELKSDKLVQKQISTYQANKNKIVELELEKINVKKSKWWLYFGG